MDLFPLENAAASALQQCVDSYKDAFETVSRVAQQMLERHNDVFKAIADQAAESVSMAVLRRHDEQVAAMAAALSASQEAIASASASVFNQIHETLHRLTLLEAVEIAVSTEERDRALAQLELHTRYRRPRVVYRSPCTLRRNEGTHIPTYAVFWDGARLHLNSIELLPRRAHESRRYPQGCPS